MCSTPMNNCTWWWWDKVACLKHAIVCTKELKWSKHEYGGMHHSNLLKINNIKGSSKIIFNRLSSCNIGVGCYSTSTRRDVILGRKWRPVNRSTAHGLLTNWLAKCCRIYVPRPPSYMPDLEEGEELMPDKSKNYENVVSWPVWETNRPVTNTLRSSEAGVKQCIFWSVSEWVIKFNGVWRTADSEVHIIHISHVIITYILESLSSITYITYRYWEKRRGDSFMLATIRDDTWNMLNMQHMTPNSIRWDYSDIPSGGKKKTHQHGWRWPTP